MTSKITINLTDEDEADFAQYLRDDAPTPADLVRKDYIDGNIKLAADAKRKQATEAKRAELPDQSRELVALLEKQQFATKSALIEVEYAKIPPKDANIALDA